MASLKRQLNDPEKKQVLDQQRRNGVLYCFVDDHPIDDENDVEFHHIKPYSEDGPTEIANIGAVCRNHHRRIRTLSLSEFRDQLSMDQFFDHKDPRRLDDLLTFKLNAGGFGRKVTVEQNGESPLTLHFTNPDRQRQTCNVFACPATGMRYFYAVLPIEYLCNDAELQPRPLEQKRVWELYRHLTAHTQLAPAVCRLVDGKVMLFDGQHKSAAQIWAGRKLLDCKVYINPDVRLLKDTNLVAHDKLRQMAFFTSTLIAKYSDIFKQEWEEYVDRPGSKNEADFVTFLQARGKTKAEAKKMVRMAIEQDVIDNPDNKLSEFIAERNRTRKTPLSLSILEKTFFKEFIFAPPTAVEFESPEDFRDTEKKNLVQLLSLIAESLLIGRWNPDANNAAHQRAERIFAAGAMRAWVPMLRDAIAQVLRIYDEVERQKVLFRNISDSEWSLILDRLNRLFSHKVWEDPNPDVAAQLKVNAAETVRQFLAGQGLTVNWILGGEGA
ncbi:MAG: HNH endonuclease [Planctomycetaceae bacterium]|nr:HNH endonuclease [Planctomycetaceae bacterium]